MQIQIDPDLRGDRELYIRAKDISCITRVDGRWWIHCGRISWQISEKEAQRLLPLFDEQLQEP